MDKEREGDRAEKGKITYNARTKEIGYLAGIIDGEGSIGIVKRNRPVVRRGYSYDFKIRISNTSLPLLERIREIVRGGTISPIKKIKRNHKPMWVFQTCSMKFIRKILRLVINNLVAKQKQAKLMLEAINLTKRGKDPRTGNFISLSNYDRLDQIHEEMLKLNKRGLEFV